MSQQVRGGAWRKGGNMYTEHIRSEKFLPVLADPSQTCPVEAYELVDNRRDETALKLGAILGRALHSEEAGQLAVVRWNDPLEKTFANIPPYPDTLRNFRLQPEVPYTDRLQAKRVLEEYGPLIPFTRDRYIGSLLRHVEARNDTVVQFHVPEHQGRGFVDHRIHTFQVGRHRLQKLTTATKGNGMTGYWHERRVSELVDALQQQQDDIPANPDVFHARDHAGQSTGQKKGDEIVWVGLASDHVTQREVKGFDLMAEAGAFTPLCLPVERLREIPLATGEVIDIRTFRDEFDPEANLVYLAKAWGNETRVWGSVITREANMTAGHLLSVASDDGVFEFENVLADLKDTAPSRKYTLELEGAQTRQILKTLETDEWHQVLGFAGRMLAERAQHEGKDCVIENTSLSTIMHLNMLQNVVRAGDARLYGKPVAWHLENVGLWGEVSGGERIYGKATGKPDALEFHSLFAYLFDSYSATATVAAAEQQDYVSIEGFYDQARRGILSQNGDHWISKYPTLGVFVKHCQDNKLTYNVQFRAADTFPLVAVDATDPTCRSKKDAYWKDWDALRLNLVRFTNGVREAYRA